MPKTNDAEPEESSTKARIEWQSPSGDRIDQSGDWVDQSGDWVVQS